MKKKILALCLVLVLAVTAITSATLAYFTDTMEATNVITIGNVSAELYESKYHRGSATGYLSITGQPNPTQDSDIINDSQTYQSDYLKNATLMPFNLSGHSNQAMYEACTVAKNAYVKNTSTTHDCFVRVRYIVPADVAPYLDIYYVNSQFIAKDDGSYTGKNMKSEWKDADATTLDNTDKIEPIICNVKTSGANFTLQGAVKNETDNTYEMEFIYAERLTPGEMTLFSPISKITLIPSVTNEIAEQIAGTDRQFDIKVEAEVIQADGFKNAVEAFNAYDGE